MIIAWIMFSILVGIYANKYKGKSGLLFFILSIFLSPLIAFIIALLISTNNKIIEKCLIANHEMKKCFYCAELVKYDARVCKYCGKEV